MTTVEVPHSSRSVVLTVSGVVEETPPDSRSLVFDVPADLTDKFAYKPGQFLTLRIPSDRTARSPGATRWPAHRSPTTPPR